MARDRTTAPCGEMFLAPRETRTTNFLLQGALWVETSAPRRRVQ